MSEWIVGAEVVERTRTWGPTYRYGARRPFVSADHVAERDALTSLALTMRRHSHAYRRWAAEAEERGDLDGYRHCTKEAERCWRSAKWNLAAAQREADQAFAYMEKANAAQDHPRL